MILWWQPSLIKKALLVIVGCTLGFFFLLLCLGAEPGQTWSMRRTRLQRLSLARGVPNFWLC